MTDDFQEPKPGNYVLGVDYADMVDASTIKLVTALRDSGDRRRGFVELIEKAKRGYYNDYKSPIATPCIELVKDLRFWGHTGIARRAINGEFAATKAEADAWAAGEEGQRLMQELIQSSAPTS